MIKFHFSAVLIVCFQVGLANVGKSTLFQAITKCTLGNPAV